MHPTNPGEASFLFGSGEKRRARERKKEVAESESTNPKTEQDCAHPLSLSLVVDEKISHHIGRPLNDLSMFILHPSN
jgi:hypothetical protein